MCIVSCIGNFLWCSLYPGIKPEQCGLHSSCAGNVGDFGVVYPGMDHPAMFTGQAVLTGTSKTDVMYWPRRWRLPATLELTYNETQALLGNKHCLDVNIWCYPVWWDCATDAEYEGYIK